MKFSIITHVNHIQRGDQYFGYAPYIREMNIWIKYVDEVIVVAPLEKSQPTHIDSYYAHADIDFREVPIISFTSFRSYLGSLLKLPSILWKIFCVMNNADHIHLRCPGNIGLIGCFVQILFPCKPKTAKYAGNWDPKSRQPLTYRLQKWILNNKFLTRNMQVLVYGQWPNQSENIKPFFTASYYESEKSKNKKLDLNEVINFVFAGTLSAGKNPLYAIQLVEKLYKKGYRVSLSLYGDGPERKMIENYIESNSLEKYIGVKGNQDKETLKSAYQNSHFVILPSKSEGWPKAIAEGMFWGCVPIVTKVSCIPFMLNNGDRGITLVMDLESDLLQIETIINHEADFLDKSRLAREWSQQFTLDLFESEIKKMINK